MPIVTTRRRLRKGRRIKESYPSVFAKRGQVHVARVHNAGRGPDAEPMKINCAQCNAHIIDHGNLNTCWNCGSDNFLGAVFEKGY